MWCALRTLLYFIQVTDPLLASNTLLIKKLQTVMIHLPRSLFLFFLRELIVFACFQVKIEFYSWKIHCSWNASYWIQFRGNWVKYNDLWKWSNFIIRLTREALRSVSLWSLVEAFRLFEPAPLYTVITFLKKSSSLSSETEKISQNNCLLLQLYW